jgi:protein-S-isoprenylcysteine O-methyltransferase Ste14
MAGLGFDYLVPITINTTREGSVTSAVVVNLLLLTLFAGQHSIMARPAFKRVWTKLIPKPIERSTYVLVSCLVTILLMWQWRGIDTVVWEIQAPALRTAMWALFAIGWLMVPTVSLMIDHFDLFGTRQVWLYFTGRENKPLDFRTPLAYGVVRHPLYVAWGAAFWFIPTMTVGHLLFAGVMTVYMGLAAIIEERDLVAHFGDEYKDYRRNVPMFIPSLSVAEKETSEA